jgi:hypothetical protein
MAKWQSDIAPTAEELSASNIDRDLAEPGRVATRTHGA